MSELTLHELQAVLRKRKTTPPEGSYAATLVVDPEQAARKIVEEAFETAVEIMRPPPAPDRVAAEAADLVFHLLAGLVGAGVPLDDVLTELAGRRR